MDINLLAILIGVIFPVIAGYLVKFLMNLLKNASAYVDNAPPAFKQVLVVLISTLLSLVFGFFGVELSGSTLDSLSDTHIQALLTSAFAMLFHNSDKLKKVTTSRKIS